jgi:DNA uptake protein ComE-like DNA-binding protein
LGINTAARDEFMRIPGIGQHFANLIIGRRPERAIQERLQVPGIGQKRVANLRDRLSIQP